MSLEVRGLAAKSQGRKAFAVEGIQSRDPLDHGGGVAGPQHGGKGGETLLARDKHDLIAVDLEKAGLEGCDARLDRRRLSDAPPPGQSLQQRSHPNRTRINRLPNLTGAPLPAKSKRAMLTPNRGECTLWTRICGRRSSACWRCCSIFYMGLRVGQARGKFDIAARRPAAIRISTGPFAFTPTLSNGCPIVGSPCGCSRSLGTTVWRRASGWSGSSAACST